ncbi:type VI secretion system VasD/TssJ family lipoprotein [Biostraticola tofi]|uniref:Type VI secretion system VasD/TssJ family lipoprotein n=2 Tax=Biostraticola tofi TaxID=466109 RepID=A0A4R3Z4D1_9GAMM|nr:type VI secretion system VasD/TssJ family lipoprotein [Biostraticola tofi]
MRVASPWVHHFQVDPGFNKIIKILLAILWLAGCSSSEVNRKTEYILTFIIRDDLNDGMPLRIRIFPVRNEDDFMRATFYELQAVNPKMDNDILPGENSIFIVPGEQSKFYPLQLAANISHIGLFAEFKQFDAQQWRLLLPASPTVELSVWQKVIKAAPAPREVFIRLDRTGLSIDFSAAVHATEKLGQGEAK